VKFFLRMLLCCFRSENVGRFSLRPEERDPLAYLGERELMQYYIDGWHFTAINGKENVNPE